MLKITRTVVVILSILAYTKEIKTMQQRGTQVMPLTSQTSPYQTQETPPQSHKHQHSSKECCGLNSKQAKEIATMCTPVAGAAAYGAIATVAAYHGISADSIFCPDYSDVDRNAVCTRLLLSCPTSIAWGTVLTTAFVPKCCVDCYFDSHEEA